MGVGAVPSEAWGWLPLLTGVAVVDAVAEVAGVTAGLKWPNDVLVRSRRSGKLAGILAEVAAPAPVVVVGLGLNVTEAPDPVATSLALLGAAVDRAELTEAVLSHLAARIDGWRAAGGADATLAADYRCAQRHDRQPGAGQPARRPHRLRRCRRHRRGGQASHRHR